MTLVFVLSGLLSAQEVEAYTVNEVHLKDGDEYNITSCPKNTIIYIDDKTASNNNSGEVTLKGSSEKVWVDISVSEGKTVNVKLADGLTITPRSASAYGTGDNDDTLGWSVAGIYINETKHAGGTVYLTSKKDAEVIVESYMRTNWQPVPAIMKNDTKTKLVFRTEDPSNPGTIIARIVKGGDFGGACAIGAYGHGVGGSATSSYTVGNIEFQSGNIEAYGYNDGPGIGAYAYSHVKDLNFTGAHVKAYAGNWRPSSLSAEAGGAGIGSAYRGNVGTITISDGYVEAYGRGAMNDPKGWSLRTLCTYCGPGIGVGSLGHLNEINISGGKVVAYGGTCDQDSSSSCSGCGIGTVVYCADNVLGWSSADKITMTGGDITAYGGDSACGIGGCVDEILIAPKDPDTELTITAKLDGRKDREGGHHALGAGIGIANNAKDSTFSKYSGKITIKGGDITATGGKAGSPGWYGDGYLCTGGGIGPTYSGKVSSINISGGKIQADGGYCSAGIGGYSVVKGDLATVESIHISGGTITATKPAFSKEGDPLSGIGGIKNGSGYHTDIIITGGSIIANGDDPLHGIGYGVPPENDKGERLFGVKFKYSPDVDEGTKVNSFTTDPELDYDYGLNDVYTKEGIDDEEGDVITEFWLPPFDDPLDGYICKVYMEDCNYGTFIEGSNDTYKIESLKIESGDTATLTAFTDITYTSEYKDYKYSGKGFCAYGSKGLFVDPEPQNTVLYRFLNYVDDNEQTIADIAGTLSDRTDYTDLDGAWNTTIKNLIFHPQVQQVGYMISFDKNKPSDASHNVEGSQMPDMTENVFDEWPIDLPASTYSLSGWTFTGWNTEADGSGTHFDDAGKFKRNSDWGAHVTLYAQWEPKTYTVTFDPGDATGQDTYTQEFQYDKTQKLAPNSFTYDDHGFVGWSTLAFGSFYEDQATVINRCVLNEDGTLSGMTFYAKWFEVDNLAIFIVDDGKMVNSADPSCITLKSGSLTIPADIQKSEFGYYVNNIPEGTYTVEFTGDLAVYEPYGEVEVVAGKMALYCLNYYKVTAHETEYCYSYFNGDPHQTVMEHVAPNTGLNINTGISNTLHRFDGYTSTGVEPTWENGDKTKAEQTITVNGSADIYPTDAPIQYHVAFDQNKPANASHEVEGTMENMTFTYDVEQALAQNAYTLTGWIFAGWNTQSDGSGTTYADKESVKNLSVVDEGVVSLYAQWKPNNYKVIFSATNAIGGTMDPQEFEYDSAQHLKPNAFKRTEWHFTSWNTEPNGGGTSFEDEAEVVNLTPGKSITLYAQWEHDYYTVNFDKNDEEATGEMQPEKVWTNCGYELPLCTFYKKSCSLESWNTKPDGSGKRYEPDAILNNELPKGGNMTLYAQWKQNNKPVLTVTAIDQTYVYNGEIQGEGDTVYEDPAEIVEKIKVDGLLEGDYIVSVVLDGQGKEVGTYDLVPSGSAVGGEHDKDFYDIHYVNGTLTITDAKYTIKFVNEDGTELQSGEVAYGEMPVYTGKTPTKAATAQYTYTFAGWDPEITEVTEDATYTATYSVTTNKYTITFVNEDGTVLQSSEVAFGEVPKYSGKTPEKKADAQYTYTFDSWDKEIVPVTGDATYKATYSKTVNQYSVTFVDFDGTVIKDAVKYDYGTPVDSIVKPDDPIRKPDAEFTYTFVGWTPEIRDVTADVTYTAVYSSEKNKYTITWLQDDGSLIDQTIVEYGETPVHADPKKEATAQYTYNFAGWDKEIVPVVGEATYTATYSVTTNKYTITFVNEDGTVLQSSEVAFGEVPKYNGKTPEKKEDTRYIYTFSGWTPEIVAVTGNATYTAIFSVKEKPGIYKVVSGADGIWKRGSTDPLVFIFKRTVDDESTVGHFSGIEVDGKEVPERDSSGRINYTAKKGSVIISLQPTYLSTLSEEKHTLKAIFNDGNSEEVTFTISHAKTPVGPATGDTQNPILWGIIAALALALAVGLIIRMRVRRR